MDKKLEETILFEAQTKLVWSIKSVMKRYLTDIEEMESDLSDRDRGLGY